MPMIKCNLTFGKWVGGEIENGSQKDNNYVVFPRVIPNDYSCSPLSFFKYFPQR